MSLDLTLDLPCEPKRTLGYGHVDAGTRVLINLVTMKAIGGTIKRNAAAEGRDLDKIRVRMTIIKPETEPDERDLTLAEIDSETAALNPLARHCQTCPASGGGVAFGCVRQVQYPITRAAEEWIRDRLPQPGTFAEFLMMNAIRDFNYDGGVVKRYREEKLFELPVGLASPHSPTINTDPFFHAILGVGPKLIPWHLAMILTWVNVLGLDGQHVHTLEAFETLTGLPPAERPARVSIALGAPHPDEGVKLMQKMLFAMASAWMIDVPLRVDS
jgi:hypothetical protein